MTAEGHWLRDAELIISRRRPAAVATGMMLRWRALIQSDEREYAVPAAAADSEGSSEAWMAVWAAAAVPCISAGRPPAALAAAVAARLSSRRRRTSLAKLRLLYKNIHASVNGFTWLTGAGFDPGFHVRGGGWKQEPGGFSPFPPLPLEVGPLIWCILTLKYDIWWQQFYWFSTSWCQLESLGVYTP